MALSLVVTGQSLTVKTILASAEQDPKVQFQKKQIRYISNTNQNLPFAEQFSLRTETDRFLAERQEYLARMTVNGFSEIHQQHAYAKSVLQTEESLERVYLHEALVERYANVIAYRILSHQLAIQQSLQEVYDDKVLVLKKLASLYVDADVDELIKTEYDQDELELEMVTARYQLDQLRQTVATWIPETGTDWQLDTTNFISLSEMTLLADQLALTPPENPQALEKQKKLDEIDAAYSLEKANGKQVLDFFQLRYANRPLVGLDRELSVGFGINLPYRGSSRVKLSELKIEKNDVDQNLQLYQLDLADMISEARQNIHTLNQRYELAAQQWKDSQARYSLEQPGALRADGPMILLKARELQLKREFVLLDIERDVFEQYLNLLDWTGSISTQPIVNYLSYNRQ